MRREENGKIKVMISRIYNEMADVVESCQGLSFSTIVAIAREHAEEMKKENPNSLADSIWDDAADEVENCYGLSFSTIAGVLRSIANVNAPMKESRCVKARRLDEEFSTTFWMDFSIADRFGIPAVKDTFRRAFSEWKSDYRYLTDLVLVLNHKIWQHYEKNEPLARVYNDLWEKARNYAENNLKGEELEYYYEQTN